MTAARTRSRRSAKKAGAEFERATADYLATHIDDRIDRRVKTGAKDRGDIGGLRVHGQRLVVEVKNTARLTVGPFLQEAETERGNDDALAGVVIAKRHGIQHPGSQIVLMTVDDLIALITSARPTTEGETA